MIHDGPKLLSPRQPLPTNHLSINKIKSLVFLNHGLCYKIVQTILQFWSGAPSPRHCEDNSGLFVIDHLNAPPGQLSRETGMYTMGVLICEEKASYKTNLL